MSNLFYSFKNAEAIPIDMIPIIPFETWRDTILETCQRKEGRLVALFATPEKQGHKIYVILGMDLIGELQITSVYLTEKNYPSLTPLLTQAHLFERELAEEYGIIPKEHPWLKPVRKLEGYSFYKMEGDEIHEVAVGPVHAGIIEPGHFRFQCHGEKVFHLEIQLGYQHRGLEQLMVAADPSHRAVLAESIAGDTVIGHGLAFCEAMEALSNNPVSPRANGLRAIVLELERLANHVGDLGALASDVGFLPASAYFGRLRGEFLNLLMELTGNRFGRSFLKAGGVVSDMTQDMRIDFKKRILAAASEINEVADLFFNAASVLARLEHTGVVTLEGARSLGCVGLTARSSGLFRDVRHHYPTGTYQVYCVSPSKLTSGDVHARARIRFLEAIESCKFILNQLDLLTEGVIVQVFPQKLGTQEVSISEKGDPLFIPPFEKGGLGGILKGSSLVVSLVEGWRGEIAHVVLTGEAGEITRYKIVDPSFHNWMALAIAMRDGEISDFPLCNKSFNLSYAGHDL